MADDNQPQDVETSDDPQAQAAANGFNALGITPKAVTNAISDVPARGDEIQPNNDIFTTAAGVGLAGMVAPALSEAFLAGIEGASGTPFSSFLADEAGELRFAQGAKQAASDLENQQWTTTVKQPPGSPEIRNIDQKFVIDATNPEQLDQAEWKVGQPRPKKFADGGMAESISPEAQQMLTDVNNTAPDTSFNSPTPTTTNEPKVAESATNASVNVVNPEGKLVSIPTHQLNEAVNQGYRPASKAEVESHAKEEKYGSLSQKLLTGAEGAAEAISFGTSPALEQATGLTTGEDIRGRRETNPGSHMAGQLTGLAASSLIPVAGEANVLNAVGEAGVSALGMAGAESALGKIGSSAVKAAIENMAFQGTTEEVSKLLTQDPQQSAETAIADIGLAGLIGAGAGGAFGAVSPLWSATMGSKTSGLLKAIADRAGGIDGVTPDVVDKAITTLGVDVKPEVRAAMASDPSIQALAKTLEQSDTTKAGLGYQEALKDFRAKTNDALVSALGRSPEELAGGDAKTVYEAGVDAKTALIKSIKQQIDPISEQFDQVKSKFKELALPTDSTTLTPTGESIPQKGTISEIADKIGQAANEYGWSKSPSSEEMQLVNRINSELPLQKTLNDLKNFQSTIADEAQRKQLWKLGSTVRTIMRNAEDDVVTKALGEQAPELLEKHALARGAYKDAMTTVDQLNDRLHVGKYSGPASFLHAIEEMKPEDVMRRLSGKGDVDMLNLLHSRFPDVAKEVRNYHLDQALNSAAKRAQPGEIISPKALITAIDKMSPELQKFVLPEGAQAKLEAVAALKEQLERVPHNFSNTGRTVDKLLNYLPGSAVAMASAVAGHNPVMSSALGYLTKYMARDVPDAARLALLKFLGSNKPVNAQGFKSMFDYAAATIKGENALAKGVKGIFKAGTKVIPEAMLPSESDRKKLNSRLDELKTNPSSLYDAGGSTAHYLPDHGQALAASAAKVTGFLNQVKPVADKRLPFDTENSVSSIKKAQYNRALDIAQQPLIVLNHIKDGSLTSKDVIAFKSMYPSLYNRMAGKMTSELADMKDGDTMPYKTRLSLALFVGQPLDSTMTPQAIISAQPVPKPEPQPNQNGKAPSKSASSALQKLPGMYQTPNQASQQRALKD